MDALDPALAASEALQDEYERLCRLNGRLEFAAELQDWMIQNKARLPQWIVDDIAGLIVAASSAPATTTTRETRH